MGRNKDAYWESRRGMRAFRARWTPAWRAEIFDRDAVIKGERGRVGLEALQTPPMSAPEATWRVLARWTGDLPRGSVITVEDRPLAVLHIQPRKGSRPAAIILCRDLEGSASGRIYS